MRRGLAARGRLVDAITGVTVVPPASAMGAATITGWHGIFAPAATPPELMARYEAASRQAAANPRFANRLEPDGLEPAPRRSRAEFQAAIRAEHDFWGRKIREQNLRLE